MSPAVQNTIIYILLIFLSLPLLILNGGPYALRLFGYFLKRRSKTKRAQIYERLDVSSEGRRPVIIGFFHPYCNAGGGGERVLWTAIRAVQREFPHVISIVYTGDHQPKPTLLSNVQNRFDITLNPSTIEFIHLQKRRYVDPTTWPRFTLAGQSLGSVFLALEALGMLVPDVFIDTMGYAFAVGLVKAVCGIPTAAYVHYPTISADMLGSLSPAQGLKKAYWRLFAVLYGGAGRGIDVVAANSSWTAGHMRQLWSNDVEVIFPPCAASKMSESVGITKKPRGKNIVCIAQFRPEKNHELLIRSFAKYVTDSDSDKSARLVLIGSVRHEEDEKKVYELRILTNELQIKERVEFVINASWLEILSLVGDASVGANGMWNEHFGIGVVEYQAAGLISVVHDSGGPKMDIVVDIDGRPTGYHATDVPTFAAAFEKALNLPELEAYEMRLRARKSSERFSEEVFGKKWVAFTEQLLDMEKETGGGWRADQEFREHMRARKVERKEGREEMARKE